MADNYRTGLETLDRAGLEGTIANKLAEVAPDFARMAIAFPYGEIFSRPGLDLKTRELLALSNAAALGHAEPQLRGHVIAALRLGWKQAEIVEALMQTAVIAGFAAASNALVQCHDLLVEGGAYCAPCHSAGSGAGQR